MQGKRVSMEHLFGSTLSRAITKARETPCMSTGSLILLVPVRECFLATLLNLPMVAHLANTGFPTQGPVTPKTHHLLPILC